MKKQRKIELACKFCQSGAVRKISEEIESIEDRFGVNKIRSAVYACLRCGRVSVHKEMVSMQPAQLTQSDERDSGPSNCLPELEPALQDKEWAEPEKLFVIPSGGLQAGDRAKHNAAGEREFKNALWRGEITEIRADNAVCIDEKDGSTWMKPLKYIEKSEQGAEIIKPEEPLPDAAPAAAKDEVSSNNARTDEGEISDTMDASNTEKSGTYNAEGIKQDGRNAQPEKIQGATSGHVDSENNYLFRKGIDLIGLSTTSNGRTNKDSAITDTIPTNAAIKSAGKKEAEKYAPSK